MKLILYGFSHDTEINNQLVSIEEALALIENQQSLLEEKDNYIGFQIPGLENCIQFYREDHMNWVIDIPVYYSNNYEYSKAGRTTTRMVRDIIHRLFDPKSRLYNSLHNGYYDEIEEMMSEIWNINMKVVD